MEMIAIGTNTNVNSEVWIGLDKDVYEMELH